MGRTIRKRLVRLAERGMRTCDTLDMILMQMSLLSENQNSAIIDATCGLLEVHAGVKELWRALRLALD